MREAVVLTDGRCRTGALRRNHDRDHTRGRQDGCRHDFRGLDYSLGPQRLMWPGPGISGPESYRVDGLCLSSAKVFAVHQVRPMLAVCDSYPACTV
ncbi:MAG: hypothetical protein CM1200mP14_23840 [Gammaproteobacteria bacterium]|nr:MAG: hypothetical protein CM1200mP14_23840 [Gammaproteobacteria bacterium]